MIKCSSKLVLVDKLLQKLIKGNNKVLIFSQMLMVLDIIEGFILFLKLIND